MITNKTGNVAKEKKYEAFGNLKWQSGTYSDNRDFTGKEKDPTGFHYFGARYYSGDIGRFLSPDPHTLMPGNIRLANSQSHNPYVYCVNNPLIYFDPWGLDWYYYTETGELLWFFDNDAKGPQGSSYLGKDYFGTLAEGEMTCRSLEEGKKAYTFSVAESQAFAEEYGFKMVETQNYVYDKGTIMTYIGGPQGRNSPAMISEWNIERTIINESYTYVPKENNIRNVQVWENRGTKFSSNNCQAFTSSAINKIEWQKGNILQKIFNDLTPPSLGRVTSTFTYNSWKEYPVNGILREIR